MQSKFEYNAVSNTVLYIHVNRILIRTFSSFQKLQWKTAWCMNTTFKLLFAKINTVKQNFVLGINQRIKNATEKSVQMAKQGNL